MKKLETLMENGSQNVSKSIKNQTFGVRVSDFCDAGKVLGGFKKNAFSIVEEISLSSAQGGAGGG